MVNDTLSKSYDPSGVEEKWCKHWEETQAFTPDINSENEPYSIVIPPPNVTGVLHIGHALNLTLQDVLCRYYRQKGRTVLWVPGTDHAGIATQNVVERALAKDGKTRHDLGRDAFIETVWDWKNDYGTRILDQIKAMGASVDWTRQRFTMDAGLSKSVRKVFVELYNKGYIYKGDYIINWCNRCHTALSDDEVEHEERGSKLWHIRYHLTDGSDSIVVATTRPETILGDSAVCVHPEDERYLNLIGKFVYVPVLKREIPIIADNYVDKDFGTGALKVTPSHDHNDWELGKRHNLEFIQVIDDMGIMKEEAGPYAGLTKEKCRTDIVAELEKLGDLVEIEDIKHSVGHCYRCYTTVEPHVSTQWFVAATKLAPRARAAVPEQTQIFPSNWQKTYFNWLDNIRDWCISRQIWWGHRIPAWTCEDCGQLIVAEEAPSNCPECKSNKLIQDPDVLDTWFSSALWPFSTMGWPEKTKELQMFYPTSVLITGFDILFFWVARMMMLGLEFMDKVPFHHVYIHALVRDAHGKKMSKSTGNVIDPLEMIDKYGCDSLRFTLTAFAAMGRDIRLSEDRIEGYRHFVNKLWNAARFSLMNLPENEPQAVDFASIKEIHHCWILSSLEDLKDNMDDAIQNYRFNEVAQLVYKFLWANFCDWYLELIKPDMQAGGQDQKVAQYVLYTVIKELLVLMHPVMPFVTAEIWQALPGGAGKDIARELYPVKRPECKNVIATQQMEFLQEVIIAVRTIRAELNISPALKLQLLLKPADLEQKSLLDANVNKITVLARLQDVTIDSSLIAPSAAASSLVKGCEVIVPLSGTIDFKTELERLNKELAKIVKEKSSIEAKLSNAQFIERAPAAIVEKDRQRILELSELQGKLDAMVQKIENMMADDS